MSARTPNILWIVTTQWRAQACGYAGDPNARTPALDALARQSVNFSQAVTPHPFGPWARAALLTGVASPANGVRDYFDALPADARTVAQALRERGYATAFFGKWGVGQRDQNLPLVGEAAARVPVPEGERGGFETWVGFEGGFQLNDPWLNGARQIGYQSDVVTARAADWLRAKPPTSHLQVPKENAPWFCVVSLEAPHPPYDAPAAGVEPRAVELVVNVPRGGDAEAKARRELTGYYAHIEATDRAIGRLIAQAGDDTIVVFTSVHGDMHGAHGLFRKGWPHEESVRVPLLVRRKGSGFGVSSSALVSLVDLTRWTVAWVEGKPETPNPKPGTEIQRISMPSVVALPWQCDRVWRGVRTATRKLVLNADGSPWLFFDLANDPLELNNLAGDPAWAAEIAELKAQAG